MTTTITISLLSISPTTTVRNFLRALKNTNTKPLLTARVVQWIITPTYSPHLLHHNWDILLILQPNTTLPPPIATLINTTFSIRINQSLDFLFTFPNFNQDLLYPNDAVPLTFNLDKPIMATSSQSVALTPSLLSFARSDICPKGPVSMLNFISFHPFESARSSYSTYIEGFKSGMGSKRGGAVKILGDVAGGVGEWDEMVVAQYPSLLHFADMCADGEYQELNRKWRLPALRDTGILMCSEVDVGWEVEGSVKR